MAGVFAYSSAPKSFILFVPGYNGSINSFHRTKAQGAVVQTITAVGTIPNADSLDIILRFENGSNASSWLLFENQHSITYANASALLAGSSYYQHLDSRIYYTASTTAAGYWSVN